MNVAENHDATYITFTLQKMLISQTLHDKAVWTSSSIKHIEPVQHVPN